jgi:hypothetical protein
MKIKVLLVSLLITGASLMAACGQDTPTAKKRKARDKEAEQQQASLRNRVPAFSDPLSARNLGAPTLPPERFTGPTRDAYRMVREIPETIAQLPCYCHCDQSFGHKSLYSCFQDEHASQCAVCVNEVLIAYDLQKNSGMTPAQIRERIIAQYSAMQ